MILNYPNFTHYYPSVLKELTNKQSIKETSKKEKRKKRIEWHLAHPSLCSLMLESRILMTRSFSNT
jgi:hypothetical protein